MMRAPWLSALALLLVACSEVPPPAPANARLVVIGFDGMDPRLAERWMDEGLLPEFDRLRREGHYQPLATSNPPQSPVAWSSFATGLGPGGHGIHDFLRRDPATYQPDFSIARYTPPRSLNFVGWRLPLGEGELRNLRQGQSFWLSAEEQGRRATVLRVPVTYPPEPVQRMLAGMGVPDLLGSQGTYTYYSTRRPPPPGSGGRVVQMRMTTDGRVETELAGPAHPLRADAPALSLPMILQFDAEGAQVELAGESRRLAVGEWSDWWPLSFEHALGTIPGMVRLQLISTLPRPQLYVSPIQADPTEPVLPLTAPPQYAPALAERIGRFHTLGMPEETWSLNQGHLPEQAFLDMIGSTLAEGEAMLRDALAAGDSELVVKVFVQTDRVSHMFWRGLDPQHPLYADSSPTAREAVRWIYREADRVLGEVRRQLNPQDRLVVLSDHGFAPFRRAVHLNRWLIEQGWLVLQEGASESAPLFAEVDLARSRAYALGLNGLYLNLQGREAKGIVAAADRDRLLDELVEQLAQWRDVDGQPVVRRSFRGQALYPGPLQEQMPDLVIGYAAGYRASWQTSLGGAPAALIEDNLQPWSGDHCIDPELVPGVLFLSFQPQQPPAEIADMAHFLLQHMPAGP